MAVDTLFAQLPEAHRIASSVDAVARGCESQSQAAEIVPADGEKLIAEVPRNSPRKTQ